MPLVQSVPWVESIIDAPPIRLHYQDVEVPEDMQFTFVGTRHDEDGGLPDYLRGILRETDLLLPELPGWDAQLERSYQKVADGDFSARQKIIQATERLRKIAPGQVAWQRTMFQALFNSKVKVAMVDYPYRHPGDRALQTILAQGMPINEDTMPHFARRDEFIVKEICAAIPRLRQENRKLASKEPLKVLALFGAAHVAVYHALVAKAEEQGVNLSEQLLFEESVAFTASSIETAEDLNITREEYIRYQNWLRKPE